MSAFNSTAAAFCPLPSKIHVNSRKKIVSTVGTVLAGNYFISLLTGAFFPP
jgi:hypothetical protein